MMLGLRVLLLLGVAMLPHVVSKKDSVMFGKGTKLNGRKVRLIMDASIQHHILSMSSATLANTSLSPWTYRDSCDESRLPRKISHAQCLTSGCLSLQGEGEDFALEAKPIYYPMLVLRRIPLQKEKLKGRRKIRRRKYDLRLGLEVVTVGCTCVRPSVVHGTNV
ncbi:interleukin 17a/f3 [Thalassophryne amazonica]|uniref:interleukin 17a/f3 n=1 Tax=Thalassophryne amazonica TaxID=390379 RepID=UPI0014716C1B|nr:interleukin 17a/f3 [Thalassophryne amazonica]